MKAIICPKYGPAEVLRYVEKEKPTPADDEVLIKIAATAVTASDLYIRGLMLPLKFRILMRLFIGWSKPRQSVIGLVLAGEIESVGKNIRRFKAGDQVYGLTGFDLGAYAEYKCMKETDSTHGAISIKPQNITFEEATMAAYGGLLAFQYLEKGNIKRGQRVLIYGASGTTGTIAVQYAKYLGAHVTAVCSTANVALVESLGADEVIDYKKQQDLNSDIHFDFMLDAVGKSKTSPLKTACKKALLPKGKYVSIDDGNLLLESGRLEKIRTLVEGGYIKPVVDRIYNFNEMVEAHHYVETGHKRGGVAVKVNP